MLSAMGIGLTCQGSEKGKYLKILKGHGEQQNIHGIVSESTENKCQQVFAVQ